MLFLPLFLACFTERVAAESDVPWDRETEPVTVTPLACDACGGDCVYEEVTYAGRFHTAQDVVYADPPPVGGPHAFCWLDRGVYDGGILSDERWIHNLEHGDIVLLWDCPEGCAADVASLEATITSLGAGFVLAANDDLPTRFAILGWEHRLLIDCVDPVGIGAFVAAHFGQGPEVSMANEPAPDVCGDPYEQ